MRGSFVVCFGSELLRLFGFGSPRARNGMRFRIDDCGELACDGRIRVSVLPPVACGGLMRDSGPWPFPVRRWRCRDAVLL